MKKKGLQSSRRKPRPPTIREIAELTGVHASTVSRVLRQTEPPDGWSEAAMRIRQTAVKLGYRPNLMAASLRTRQTYTIGVLMPRLTDVVMAITFQALEEAANQAGYQVLLSSPPDNIEAQEKSAQLLLDRQVDGLVISNVHHPADEFVDAIRAKGVPMLLVNRHGGSDAHAVLCDNRRGGYLATRHLLDLGHRRIGVVAGPKHASTAYDRVQGYLAALAEAGIVADPGLVVDSEFEVEGGLAAGRQLLTQPDRPTAIFAVNDTAAIGVMGVARDLGFKIPQDLSVVGYNDIPLASQLTIPLTTIRSPSAEMGRLGLLRLLDLIRGVDVHRTVLPVELVVRQSSGPAPGKMTRPGNGARPKSAMRSDAR